MSPEHQRLSQLLEEASGKYGSRRKLAKELLISTSALGYLITGTRFVTMHQALRIEAVLGVSARELLIEAATAKIDEALEKARGAK